MQNVTIALLGLQFGLQVPSSSEELNKLAAEINGGKVEDVALDESLSNLNYRTYYPKLRRALSDAIEANGFERKKQVTKSEKTGGDTVKFLETEAKHIERARADGATTDTELSEIGAAWIASNDWCKSCLGATERKGKLPADIVATAETLLADENKDFDAVEAKFQSVLGVGFVLDRDGDEGKPSADTLGRALLAYRNALTKAAQF